MQKFIILFVYYYFIIYFMHLNHTNVTEEVWRSRCIKPTHLSPYVVDEAVHAWLHTEAVLAWQELWIAEPVQAHAARQQRLELLHLYVCPVLGICKRNNWILNYFLYFKTSILFLNFNFLGLLSERFIDFFLHLIRPYHHWI